MKRLILIILFSKLFGGEYFYDISKINLASIFKTKTICQTNYKNRKDYCYHLNLSYPVLTKFSKFKDYDIIRKFIDKDIKKFNKNNLQKALESIYNDEFLNNAYINDDIYIKLFSITKNILTLEKTLDGYAGGAHGYSEKVFINIDKDTKKEIKLNDIIKNFLVFLKVAELEYKKQNGLKENDSLEKDG